ncbi:protein UsfY [Mycobacterium hubeiense]|uniref:protein UsfY n=1 Tax=Mycobacterium hubeiense TaxID=1867256 RepID=UPI000C7ECB7F|nr:protein UsfY [Mycobacterium sp. QGD 101]
MANTHDPVDHFRTTQQHAGEPFIDIYCWPGLLSIALGLISLSGCVAAAAYKQHQWVLTTGVVGALAIAGGIAWLVVEHHRVLRIERQWLAEHRDLSSDRRPTLSQPQVHPH